MNYVSGDLRDQLAHVGHEVVRAGLVVGSGGNLSARPRGEDWCWVTAAGSWLDRLDRDCFVRVGLTDVEPESGGPMPGVVGDVPPTSELALHLATYRARPDVRAIVHLHPQSVLLLDALGERVRLVTTDHAFYLRRVAVVPFRLPGSIQLAELAAATAVDGTNCLILRGHGCSVLADSVELAHKRAANLEEAARLTYRALLAGGSDRLSEVPAEFLAHLDDDPSTV